MPLGLDWQDTVEVTAHPPTLAPMIGKAWVPRASLARIAYVYLESMPNLCTLSCAHPSTHCYNGIIIASPRTRAAPLSRGWRQPQSLP